MSDEIERYLSGFMSSPKNQSTEVKGDPQIAGLRAVLSAELDAGLTCVVDFGMGSGILATQLQTIEPFQRHSSIYWGVDLELTTEPVRVAGLDSGWLSSGRASFCQVKDMHRLLDLRCERLLIVGRNVGHELDPEGWLALIELLLTHSANTVSVLWQDMSRLPVAEVGNAPWSGPQVAELFTYLGFEVRSPIGDESRSGTPWYTLIARRANSVPYNRTAMIRMLQRSRRRQLDLLVEPPVCRDQPDITTLRQQTDVFSLHRWLRDSDILYKRLLDQGHCITDDQRIVDIQWADVLAGLDRFAGQPRDVDLVIGVARGGLPLAIAMAMRLERSEFGVYLKRYTDDDADRPFAVFDMPSRTRRGRQKVEDGLVLPGLLHRREVNVLVVDDVTTFGNTLESATDAVIKRLGVLAHIEYYVHAVDLNRLSTSKQHIFVNLHYAVEIDNRKMWLRFPWERGWST